MNTTNPTPTAATGEAGPVAGFTPGSWEVLLPLNGYPVITSESGTIAKTDCSLSPGKWIKDRNEAVANARLIAMAPELLRQVNQLREALEAVVKACDHGQLIAQVQHRTLGQVIYLQCKSALASVQPEAKP